MEKSEIGFQYKHTRFPQDRIAALSNTLSIPGFQLAGFDGDGKNGKCPETTFTGQYIKEGYREKAPFVGSEHQSLLQILSDRDENGLIDLIDRVKKDLKQWEFQRSAQIVHRRDGLSRFLNKLVIDKKTSDRSSSKGSRNAYQRNANKNKNQLDWKDIWLKEFSMGKSIEIKTLNELPFFPLNQTDTVCRVLEGLSRFRCPVPLASWFVKITWLKNRLQREQSASTGNYYGSSGNRSQAIAKVSRSGYQTLSYEVVKSIRFEWTKRLMNFFKNKIRSIPQYKQKKNIGMRANNSLLRKQQLNKRAKTLSKPNVHSGSDKDSSTVPPINKEHLSQFNYICTLARWQFDCGMLHQEYFIAELLVMLEEMRVPVGLRKRVLPLSLCCILVAYTLDYVEEMSIWNIERLWAVCTKTFSQLLWTGSSSEGMVHSDPDFKPLCFLLQLGVRFASTIGRERIGVKAWDESISYRFKLMVRAKPPNTNNKTQKRSLYVKHKQESRKRSRQRAKKPASFFFVKSEAEESKMPSVTVDFSKMQEKQNFKERKREKSKEDIDTETKIYDPWSKVEYIPNTESLFHLLSKARRMKRK